MKEVENSSLLHKILSISKAIAGELDYQNILSRVASEINQLIPYDHMDITIILSNDIECRSYEVGIETQWGKDVGENHIINKSPIRSVLLGKEPYLLTGNALIDDRFNFEDAYAKPIFDAKLYSRIIVPLIARGGIIGSLNISNHKKNKYDQKYLSIAIHLADLLASHFFAMFKNEEAQKAVIAKSKALNREKILRIGALRLTQGMEKERKRIGMDLHDQTLADLTRIMHYISRLEKKETASIVDMAFLKDEINTCLNELRNIIEDTKPGILELFGLSQAIEAQLERSVAGIAETIKINVIDNSDAYIDTADISVRTNIFRIIQEAINNAIKHSDAKEISVNINKNKTNISIDIIDNGNGNINNDNIFNNGLDNMKFRASLISSTILMDNFKDGYGTHISLKIPFSAVNNKN